MTLNIVTHREILLTILKDIFTDNTLGPFLGFKGGTAALLFYGLDRFSVDLDFDLLAPEKEDYVFEKIQEILARYGEIEDAYRKRFNLFFLLSYAGREATEQKVKVEINRHPHSSHYVVLPYLGISMKVMDKDDMAANKLLAMYERLGRTNRDIFDVYFFLSNHWPINKRIVEERSGGTYKEFLQKMILALENFETRSILGGLGELVTEKQKPWIRNKLKTETLFLLRLALEQEK